MRLQYASFLLPLWPDSPEQEALNRFIRGHRVIQTRKKLVENQHESSWAFLVEYLDSGGPTHTETSAFGDQIKNKIDYKEVLSEADFSIYSKLRETRKTLAEKNGIPVYAVCANEQLAEMAKRRPTTLADIQKIPGIGKGKGEKYAPDLLAVIQAHGGAAADNKSTEDASVTTAATLF